MLRNFPLFCAAILFSATISAAPQVPLKDQSPIYLPTTEGTKLVYTSSSKEGSSTQTDTVKTVEQKEKTLTVTIERSVSDGTKNTLKYQMTAEGLFRLDAGGSKTHCKVRLPFKSDETWDFMVDDLAKYTYTSQGKEKVKVNAGTFDAICVETVPPRVTREYFILRTWYAHGVGIVKEERVLDGVVTETKELTSITKAKR